MLFETFLASANIKYACALNMQREFRFILDNLIADGRVYFILFLSSAQMSKNI